MDSEAMILRLGDWEVFDTKARRFFPYVRILGIGMRRPMASSHSGAAIIVTHSPMHFQIGVPSDYRQMTEYDLQLEVQVILVLASCHNGSPSTATPL